MTPDTNSLRCLIVEDEPLAREIISRYVQQTPTLQLAGECANAIQAFTFLQQHPVDLMFLDIRMPQLNGNDFLKALQNPPKVIFTTAYPDYALESYELDAIDYLVKPIRVERFLKAINKVESHFRLLQQEGDNNQVERIEEDYIFIKAERKYFKIYFREIFYIEGMKDYLKIHTNGSVIVTHQTMGEMENILPSNQFIRIHKSYVVSVSHIKAIFGNSVDMTKALLPIGLNYKEAVMSFIAGKPHVM